ncbi:hypothetical protein [Actinoplanes sp. NPDC051859]|uniref:hypothetical protein n=1 Tax=Actinoplanes sp. NPDC051859 TaxID=3363909 RepID=UPI00379D30B4
MHGCAKVLSGAFLLAALAGPAVPALAHLTPATPAPVSASGTPPTPPVPTEDVPPPARGDNGGIEWPAPPARPLT